MQALHRVHLIFYLFMMIIRYPFALFVITFDNYLLMNDIISNPHFHNT